MDELSPELKEIGICIVQGWKGRLERGIVFGPLPCKRLLSPSIPATELDSEERLLQFSAYLRDEGIKVLPSAIHHWRLEPTVALGSTDYRFDLVVYPNPETETQSGCSCIIE